MNRFCYRAACTHEACWQVEWTVPGRDGLVDLYQMMGEPRVLGACNLHVAAALNYAHENGPGKALIVRRV
jgi:hypothetical protein